MSENKDVLKIKKEIDLLITLITKHNKLYYDLDKPEISDQEYDEIKSRFKDLLNKYPQLTPLNNPLTFVGYKPNSKFNKIKFSIPMLSLENAFNTNDIEIFFIVAQFCQLHLIVANGNGFFCFGIYINTVQVAVTRFLALKPTGMGIYPTE